MFRNKSVDVHQFAMIPRADVPRSSFKMQRTYKTTFGGRNATGTGSDTTSYLIPVFCEEILPGDSWRLSMTAFVRLATPLFPVMDNLYLDTFFFFCPNRLVWSNWQRFMGERSPNTDSSIDYVIPVIPSGVSGYLPTTIYDYMGIPTDGQAGGFEHSALPFRMYNLIWNEWFRDQNLQNMAAVPTGDGPDTPATYQLLPRNKRHDYFTSCLPFPQKGEAVSLPLGTTAPVIGTGVAMGFHDAGNAYNAISGTNGSTAIAASVNSTATGPWQLSPLAIESGVVADLSQATAATINQLRQSFQIQRLLERDARGGTRYTEIIRSHFGVVSPDARLQRPEYLGGGTTPISINPIAQTSATTADGTDAPLGTLGAMGTSVLRHHGFTQSFTEHGYVIGLVSVRADLTYQQGLRRHWSRRTRYDFYFPAFAHLGEQAVLRKEIYLVGNTPDDDLVFGYQERWAEYRYLPSQITGYFNSTTPSPLDAWHFSQRFGAPPVMNTFFIQEAPPVERALAVGAEANGQQYLMDAFFDINAVRPLPMYSVPGLIDHF